MSAVARRLQTEVRVQYKPSPKFLDIRGSLASTGVDGGLYPMWRPGENHIELRGHDRYAHFGVARSSFLMRCTEEDTDSTKTLLQFFFDQIATFAKPTRFSIAARYISRSGGPFDTMVQQAMGPPLNRALDFLRDYNTSDIGWLFDLEILGTLTLVKIGPMQQKQIIDYISSSDFSDDGALGRAAVKQDDIPQNAWFVGVTDQASLILGENLLVPAVTARLAEFDQFAERAVTGFLQLGSTAN